MHPAAASRSRQPEESIRLNKKIRLFGLGAVSKALVLPLSQFGGSREAPSAAEDGAAGGGRNGAAMEREGSLFPLRCLSSPA
jgi:hypothetical protein